MLFRSGVWIEIELCGEFIAGDKVTPCVGVWIEIGFAKENGRRK